MRRRRGTAALNSDSEFQERRKDGNGYDPIEHRITPPPYDWGRCRGVVLALAACENYATTERDRSFGFLIPNLMMLDPCLRIPEPNQNPELMILSGLTRFSLRSHSENRASPP